MNNFPDNQELILSDDGKTLIGIDESINYDINSITIPNSVEIIGERVFEFCESLTSITIPDSVKEIGEGAFAYSGIKSIIIPNGVLTIKKNAFALCESLISITIPDSVKEIGESVFLGSGITSITIPKGVTKIGKDAFNSCDSLSSIVVEDGNLIYDSRNDCNAIIETACNKLIIGCKNTVIPNTVTSIGKGAFDGCSSLVSIVIPNKVANIEANTFEGCDSLSSIVVEDGNLIYDSRNDCNAIIETACNKLIIGCKNTLIPNTVTSIGKRAFAYCSSLNSVTIPNSVTNIGDHAFSSCDSLGSICLPNSVTAIGEEAFQFCSSLTSITISNRLTSIGKYVFGCCNDICKIYIQLGKEIHALNVDRMSDNWIGEYRKVVEKVQTFESNTYCIKCKMTLHQEYNFCPYCGAAQGKSCSCGAINIPLDAFFCPECGSKL